MAWFESKQPLLTDLVSLNARWRGRQTAVVCGDERLTWQELDARFARIAAALAGIGLSPGERVALLMDNSIDMLVAMFGAACGGYVAVPLNTSVADAGIEAMLVDCDARLVVASEKHAARIDAMRRRLGTAHYVLAGAPGDGWTSLDALERSADGNRRYPPIRPDDECNIIFSSGTTGLPKGIVHSHACRMAWARDLSLALRYHGAVRTLVTLGLFSNISWVMLLNTVLCGGTLYIHRAFNAADCLAAIERHRITHLACVPVQLQRLFAEPGFDRVNLGSIMSVMCCGSPLKPALKLDALERLTPNFIELYGLTEGLITTQDPETAADKPGSVGRPTPGQDIRILTDDDAEAPPGTAGEIVGLGTLMMSGYLNRDDANAETTWEDADGRRWLRTGDIGYVDADGDLFIVDRKKDMIISGGQNIFPADIESVLATHPDIVEAAVIGVDSERWGETPLAVIVTGTDIADRDIIDWTNARVGKQQRISGVRQVDALPRNPNGKVLKRELKQQFADVRF